MLLSEFEATVRDATAFARELSDRYRHAAEHAGEASLRELFSSLDGERRAYARRLDERVRELDLLPRRPDPEAEWLKEAVSQFNALFRRDADTPYLESFLRAEEQFLEDLERARGLEPEHEKLAALIDEGIGDTRSALERLRAAKRERAAPPET